MAAPISSMSAPCDMKAFTIKVKVQNHDSYTLPRPVIQHIIATASNPVHGDAATISAFIVFRSRCRGQFLEVMDEESQELQELAVALFDKYGRLKEELVSNEYWKGTGVFGREMDEGALLYIESVQVQPQLRRQGLGSWALQQFLQDQTIPGLEGARLVCAWPTPVDRTENKTQWKGEREAIIKFFRKNGFRRIGRKAFFGFSPDPEHPSRLLAPENDAEGHDALYMPPEDVQDETLRPLSPGHEEEQHRLDAVHRTKFPLHHAFAASIMAGQIPMHLRAGIPAELVPAQGDIAQRVRDAYAQDPASVRKRDENGLTPLHIAAGLGCLEGVEALLALPAEGAVQEDLGRRDNAEGVIPLEACQNSMRSTREFQETMLGTWDGYDEGQLRIEFLLKKAMGEHVDGSDAQWVSSRKWGCTCGACARGWLSKKMQYRLFSAAAYCTGALELERAYMDAGSCIDHIPLPIRTKMTKSIYDAHQRVVETIMDVLRATPVGSNPEGRVPDVSTVQSVMAVSGRDASAFFRKDGRIEHALDLVTYHAREQSPVGDSEWDSMMEELAQEGNEEQKAYQGLLPCAIDLEFDLVRQRLGLNPMLKWGPYYEGIDEDADPMDYDDEDSD